MAYENQKGSIYYEVNNYEITRINCIQHLPNRDLDRRRDFFNLSFTLRENARPSGIPPFKYLHINWDNLVRRFSHFYAPIKCGVNLSEIRNWRQTLIMLDSNETIILNTLYYKFNELDFSEIGPYEYGIL